MASRSWNRVELIGNLTRDPELRYTPSGAAVCTFGLATNHTYTTSDGEKKEEVDFHKIVSWNKLAEICNQFLRKGMKVFASGRLQYREWEPTEGQKRRESEIVMEDMIILSPKSTEDIGVVEHAVKAVEDKVEEDHPKDDQPLAEKVEAVKKKEPEEKEDKAKSASEAPNEQSSSANEEVEDLPF